MKQTPPTISVIIPAYNEEKRIFSCLKAITDQSVKPKEIIVVNNNSIDQTKAIARRFKGVKVIDEPRQGRAYAQKMGFDRASGQVLARLDADTVVPHTWVEQVAAIFAQDKNVDAITGCGQTYTGIQANWLACLWAQIYYMQCRAYFGCEILWGSNMAIARKAYKKAKKYLVMKKNIHEDQDLSMALSNTKANVKVISSLSVGVDFGGVQYFDKFWRNLKMQRYTKQAHQDIFDKPFASIPIYCRVLYKLVALPLIGANFIFTATNSSIRWAHRVSRQTPVYFWYQKIKNEIDI